jgi:ribonuclease III
MSSLSLMRVSRLPGLRVNDRLDVLFRTLNYNFRDRKLAQIALTHRSVGEPHNERLEFLGDALLGALIAEELYFRFPKADEGWLTRMRATLVNKDTLAILARERDLGAYLRLGEGERKSGGWHRDSILANVVEALIGAVYLDGGMQACRTFVNALLESRMVGLDAMPLKKDPKTELQEFLQSRHLALPNYQVLSVAGEPHARIFTVSCALPELPDPVCASGKSRRKAEQEAAAMALARLATSDR